MLSPISKSPFAQRCLSSLVARSSSSEKSIQVPAICGNPMSSSGTSAPRLPPSRVPLAKPLCELPAAAVWGW
eukprot:14770301-Alexandrium_andersonii.AAC.1